MRRTFRAAAWTAASISFCTAGALAGPSIAAQGDSRSTASYTEHGGTALTAANLGLNDLTDPAPEADAADPSAPIAVHAVAPAVPDNILSDEPAARTSRSLADLVSDYSGTQTPDAESDCLARAVYWESKGESFASAANSPSSAAATSRPRRRARATGGPRSRSRRSRSRISPTGPRRARSSFTPAGSIRAGG